MVDVLRRRIKALIAKESQSQHVELRLTVFLREVGTDARGGLLELGKDGGSGCCGGGCSLFTRNGGGGRLR
jgi:hypothetical protein